MALKLNNVSMAGGRKTTTSAETRRKKYYDDKTAELLKEQEAMIALREAERKKRIAEYQQVVDETQERVSELAGYYTELEEIEYIIAKNITGNEADAIYELIETMKENCATSMNMLNDAGKSASEKIKNEGSQYEYNTTPVPYQGQYRSNSKTKGTFSCNTDVLRTEVMPRLAEIESKFRETANGIQQIQTPIGFEKIKDVPGYIDEATTNSINCYNQMVEFIENVEKVEQENIDLMIQTLDSSNAKVGNLNQRARSKEAELIKEKLLKEKEKYTSLPRLKTKNNPKESPYYTERGTFHYYQQDYDNTWELQGARIRYGSTYINCGPTSLAMIVANRLGMEFPPSALRYMADEIDPDHRLGSESNGREVFYDENILKLVGVKCVKEVIGFNEEDVGEALKSDNQMVIGKALDGNSGHKSIFTNSGHYMALTGYTEEGTINIDDPNYWNYQSTDPQLMDGYKNGFSEETVKKNIQVYYVFEFEEPELSREEIEEIVENAKERYGK